MLHMQKHVLLIAIAVLLLTATIGISSAQQDWEDDFKTNPPPGKAAFNSTCAGCHGLDGRGSEKAPNIISNTKVQRLSDAQFGNIISNGVPGTGMPAFHSLTSAQVRLLVRYLRTLQGKSDAVAIRGDSTRGRNIFFGKGGCSSCHTVLGEGGFLGPDLTEYGAAVQAKAMREGIINPNRIVPVGYRLAVVRTHDGSRVEGVVRSEDNFSVQLQSRDGGFHFLQKSELQNLEYLNQPLMPTDYGQRLSGGELDDLVSYLANPASSTKKVRSSDKAGDRE